MKIVRIFAIMACLLISADICSKAVSFSVRNLSGAPIVGGVWQWANGSPANIQGIVPINSTELKGWAWDDNSGSIKKVSLVREETNPTGEKIRLTTELIRNGDFPNSWDFALLPGGKIIWLRNYTDSEVIYQWKNFDIAYSGKVKEIIVPYVLMQDGKIYFGNAAQTIPGSVTLQDGTTIPGELKQYIPGKITLMDGTELDEVHIKTIPRIELMSGIEIPGKIKERSGNMGIIESTDPRWNNKEIILGMIKEIFFKIVMKDGTEYTNPIKQKIPTIVIMKDNKKYEGIITKEVKPEVIMDDGRKYSAYKEIVKGKVIFDDGTVIDSNGNITKQ